MHVAELVRALRAMPDGPDTRVHAFGAPREEPGTSSYADLGELAGANPALRTLGVDLAIAQGCAGSDLVHSHTWYANMAGHLASLLHGVPHVVSAHSLEPLRPWKAEQLGGGYALSSWVERTSYEAAAAVIAVSAAMREDVLRSYPAVDPDRVHTVHNGIDTDLWSPCTPPTGCGPRASTRPALGRLRRPDHPAEGAAALPARGGAAAARGADRAVRRGPEPRRSRPRSRRWWPAWPPSATEWSGSARCCRAPTWSRCSAPPPPSRALDLRAAGHRQPRGDGLRDRGGGHRDRRHPRGRRRRPPATDARAGSCRSSRPPTAPGTPSTPTAKSPTRRGARRGRLRPRPGPPRWGARAAEGQSSPSAGARSRPARWRSTARMI